MTTNNNTQPIQTNILRWTEVEIRTGISRSHAHYLVAKKLFPKPIKLGIRASGWIESEIDHWIEQRVASRDKNLSNIESQEPTSC
ncbi:AlpA family transcriptional regulator [bacterium AH-315-K03]|nr:AlpA family transcriptional regulator [bacterium AH-315-K03]